MLIMLRFAYVPSYSWSLSDPARVLCRRAAGAPVFSGPQCSVLSMHSWSGLYAGGFPTRRLLLGHPVVGHLPSVLSCSDLLMLSDLSTTGHIPT